jgi:hypothetical protein
MQNKTTSDGFAEVGWARKQEIWYGRVSRTGISWGRWYWETEYPYNLTFYDGHLEYSIGLCDYGIRGCTSSAVILNWIYQLDEKGWTSAQDIRDLLRAFNDLIGGVQSKICLCWRDQQFDIKKRLDDLLKAWRARNERTI